MWVDAAYQDAFAAGFSRLSGLKRRVFGYIFEVECYWWSEVVAGIGIVCLVAKVSRGSRKL